ncbi:type II toxin-antitoxin system HipA family toxin [Glutamicibacter sp. JC586]|uniref:type II toxin-antitoxin system HipA family toxin n=1 Tax=Glutamicibacter sp. JC586 TaxID=2590552 RepID=UPI00135A2827|nr:HipA domain-containing protein [Glutamicibacter sp. JC586]
MTVDLQELKRVARADVYCNETLAGELARRADGSVAFTYYPDYLVGGGAAIATTLLPTAEPYVGPGGALPTFFSGLLPEGHRLTVLKDATKTSLSDELTLLMAVGSDTPGNVRVVPSGSALEQTPVVAEFSNTDNLDFSALARTLDRHSIPGVQDKISATMLTTPVDFKNSAYLLKLDPRDHQHLVVNEAHHLKAAKALKLPVANNWLVLDSKQCPGLLVERFDRLFTVTVDSPTRMALEDAMQVLNQPPASKYAVSTEQVIESLALQCQAPVIARRNLYLQFVFAWLTGNGDLHGKNVSILADEHGRFSVAPIYDIPCTLVYGDNTMALTVAGKDKNLKKKHWAELAGELGLTDRAAQSANQLALKAATMVDLSELPFDGSPLRGAQRELRFRGMELQ